MGKVIQFPKMKRESVPISEEERLANIKRYQAELSLSTSIELTYHLFEQIESRGIQLRNKELDQKSTEEDIDVGIRPKNYVETKI